MTNMRWWLKGKVQSFLLAFSSNYCLAMIVIISLDRLFMVYRPLESKARFTVKFARKVVIFTIIPYILYFSNKLVVRDGYQVLGNASSRLESEFLISEKFIIPSYKEFDEFEKRYIYPTHDIIYITIIFLSNISVIVKLRMRSKKQANELGVSTGKTSIDSSKRITKMLTVISILTVVFRLPIHIILFIWINIMDSVMGHGPDNGYKLTLTWINCIITGYAITYLNSCINFFVYVTMSKQFRFELCQLFRCCKKEEAKADKRIKKDEERKEGETTTSEVNMSTIAYSNPSYTNDEPDQV